MCTRFYIEPETDELKEILDAVQSSRLTKKFLQAGNAIVTSGEIRPSNVVPVIAPGKDGKKSVFPMRWGFQIPGKPLLMNARAETAAQKPTFSESWEKHRCMIPTSWYFEWEHLIGRTGQKITGEKYMIQSRGSRITWLAGLYRIEEGLPVFTVLTREPVRELSWIHDRMPLIFKAEMIDRWIFPGSKPEELLQFAYTDLIFEKNV